MKKTYVKPQVYFEDFQLSASIAGDCTGGGKIDLGHSENDCAYTIPGISASYFAGNMCTIHPDKEGKCVQEFMDAAQFFAS